MKLLISTQYMENYGAHTWDGTGECPQYWKAKGGNDYAVSNYTGGESGISETLDRVRGKIESDDNYCREWIIAAEIVEDGYLTEYERSQIDYEGRIVYPTQVLEAA
jgi:hypothetical protein